MVTLCDALLPTATLPQLRLVALAESVATPLGELPEPDPAPEPEPDPPFPFAALVTTPAQLDSAMLTSTRITVAITVNTPRYWDSRLETDSIGDGIWVARTCTVGLVFT
jgi:hypothetical protein